MQRKQSQDHGYDYSEVGAARRCVIMTLDEYGCSSQEIAAMFGVSLATFHRYDRDVRLSRRPAMGSSPIPLEPGDARTIAVITLIRQGDFSTPVIAEALGVSVATIYRERAACLEWHLTRSQSEKKDIYRYLKFRLRQDGRAKLRIKADIRLRAVCKRRRGRVPGSNA